MRLVVDTNIFVSAGLKQLSCPAIIVRWLEESGGLLKTPATENEVFDVLRRPRLATILVPANSARNGRIFAAAALVAIREWVHICRDPKDDKFLELAVNGAADLIVSGDADLLVLETFRGIPIITPAAFGHTYAG